MLIMSDEACRPQWIDLTALPLWKPESGRKLSLKKHYPLSTECEAKLEEIVHLAMHQILPASPDKQGDYSEKQIYVLMSEQYHAIMTPIQTALKEIWQTARNSWFTRPRAGDTAASLSRSILKTLPFLSSVELKQAGNELSALLTQDFRRLRAEAKTSSFVVFTFPNLVTHLQMHLDWSEHERHDASLNIHFKALVLGALCDIYQISGEQAAMSGFCIKKMQYAKVIGTLAKYAHKYVHKETSKETSDEDSSWIATNSSPTKSLSASSVHDSDSDSTPSIKRVHSSEEPLSISPGGLSDCPYVLHAAPPSSSSEKAVASMGMKPAAH